MAVIKFYSVKSRKSVEVDVSKVKKVMLKNGRPAAGQRSETGANVQNPIRLMRLLW